ncbi:MAG: ribosome-binding factor A [Planctomycetaceae bacterium]
MAHKPDRRARVRAQCEELYDDDGVDPRQYFRPERKASKYDRKTRQLCQQVQRTLDQIFGGELRDDLLDSLRVVAVSSTASSSLLVTLCADLPPERFDPNQIEARLAEVAGWLRSEVARAITRKRTPLLVFHLLGRGGLPPAPPTEVAP